MSDRNEAPRHSSNPLAIVLWVIVGSGLLYGVSQTVIKAAALFTG
ncbi:hypothetical protein [uncultured Demequina sp.]|nr:hypothetical protein [uncultured Demequina sp.]